MTAPPMHGLGSRHAVPPDDTVTVRQVHGTGVVEVTTLPLVGDPEGDILITNTPGTAVGVRTADCMPILLSANGGAVVGAVHAGWRGTVAGAALAAVRALTERYGVAAGDIHARLGPCIRVCCYEVGEEVIGTVRRDWPEWADHVLITGLRGTPCLDLGSLNRLQLGRAGVGRMDDCGVCTCCEADTYESYRRDGESSGRMVTWIRAAGTG